jgi:hypothetical protein
MASIEAVENRSILERRLDVHDVGGTNVLLPEPGVSL